MSCGASRRGAKFYIQFLTDGAAAILIDDLSRCLGSGKDNVNCLGAGAAFGKTGNSYISLKSKVAACDFLVSVQIGIAV